MRGKTAKKSLSMLLAAALMLTTMPVTVLAESGSPTLEKVFGNDVTSQLVSGTGGSGDPYNVYIGVGNGTDNISTSDISTSSPAATIEFGTNGSSYGDSQVTLIVGDNTVYMLIDMAEYILYIERYTDNANLATVFGQAVNTTGGTGDVSAPFTASFSVSYSVSVINNSDIIAVDNNPGKDAEVFLGTNETSFGAAVIPLSVGANTVWVSVLSYGGGVTQYYKLTITRASSGGSSGGGGSSSGGSGSSGGGGGGSSGTTMTPANDNNEMSSAKPVKIIDKLELDDKGNAGIDAPPDENGVSETLINGSVLSGARNNGIDNIRINMGGLDYNLPTGITGRVKGLDTFLNRKGLGEEDLVVDLKVTDLLLLNDGSGGSAPLTLGGLALGGPRTDRPNVPGRPAPSGGLNIPVSTTTLGTPATYGSGKPVVDDLGRPDVSDDISAPMISGYSDGSSNSDTPGSGAPALLNGPSTLGGSGLLGGPRTDGPTPDETERARIHGLDMGSKDAQDGVSVIQTKEGSVEAIEDILQRMRELATQPANDSNTNQDRGTDQNEVNAYVGEKPRNNSVNESNSMEPLAGGSGGNNGENNSGNNGPGIFLLSPIYNIELRFKAPDGEEFNAKDFNGLMRFNIQLPDVTPNIPLVGLNFNNSSPRPVNIVYEGSKKYAEISTFTHSVYAIVAASVEFNDLDTTQWAKDDINELASRLIVFGTGNGGFSPSKAVTRAELAGMLVNALGLPDGYVSPYSDVSANKWYFGCIAAANEAELLGWAEGQEFNPDTPVTRAEMASAIAAMAELVGEYEPADVSALGGFADKNDIREEDLESFAWCVENGIISGEPDEENGGVRIIPDSGATRAQAAVIILRALRALGLV